MNWKCQLETLLRQSQEIGLYPAQILDFLAVCVCEIPISEWARIRGVNKSTVHQNKKAAITKINEWDKASRPTSNCRQDGEAE